MFKKILLVAVLSSVGLIFADGIASSSPKSSKKLGGKLNSPTSGSSRYSNGNFGSPKLSGKKGEQYYTEEQLSQSARKSHVSGRASYSSRSNSKVELTGKKGEQYYSKQQLSDGPNQPTQGSRIGSNQVFSYPKSKPSKSTVLPDNQKNTPNTQ